jgi:predicted MFS family arabinose efflux permease
MDESLAGRARVAVSGLRGGGGRGRLLVALALGWFLILGVRFVVPAVLPTIRAEFGVTNADAGLAVTVLWATYAAMQLPAGMLADRAGERVLLAVALLVAGVALVAYAFTPSFPLFVLATAGFGLGTGLYGPPRGTAVSNAFEEREGAAFGIMLAAGSVGAALLPALAALLTVRYGWRVALGLAAPGFLLVAALFWLGVPARLTAPDAGQARSLRHDFGTALRAVRSRRVGVAVAGAALLLFGFQAVTAFLTTYLVEVKGISQGAAGVYLSLLFVAGAVSQSVWGSAADRFGHGPVLVAVSLVSAAPLVAFPLVSGPVALAALSTVVGVRMAVGPVSNAYIIAALPDDIQGTAWGGLRTAFFAVGSVGSTFVGVLADLGLFDGAFYLLAAITAAAGAVFYFLPPRE